MNIISKILKIILIFISIILVFTAISFGHIFFTLINSGMLFSDDNDVIYENWHIRLPKEGNEIYYNSGEPSFHGDGQKLYVYEYDDEKIIDSYFNWKDKKNTNIEEEINYFLKMLDKYNDIPKEYIPNFKKKYKYLTKVENDNSKIYLIHITGENRIYVIENFL